VAVCDADEEVKSVLLEFSEDSPQELRLPPSKPQLQGRVRARDEDARPKIPRNIVVRKIILVLFFFINIFR